MFDKMTYPGPGLLYGLVFAGLYFLLAGGVYLVFRSREKRSRFKIDKRSPDRKQLAREIKFSLITLLIFISAGCFTYWLYLNGLTGIYDQVQEKGYVYLIISFFLSLLLHDFYFYWTHRFMHLPGVYQAIHKTHHLSHHTTVLSALSFHPGEALIQVAFIPMLALVLPLHSGVLLSFVFYNLLVNIAGHSGYEFFPGWFKRSSVGKWSNTPVYHYAHHCFVKKNYGLYLSLWDKLMGTYNEDTEKLFNSPLHVKSNGDERDQRNTELPG